MRVHLGDLDPLPEDAIAPTAIRGMSSGAIIGTMPVQGRGNRTVPAHPVSAAKPADGALAPGSEMTMRLRSPARLDPFGHNHLWYSPRDLVDRRLPRDRQAGRTATSKNNTDRKDADNATDSTEFCISRPRLRQVVRDTPRDGQAPSITPRSVSSVALSSSVRSV